jgi:HNH endonuclease
MSLFAMSLLAFSDSASLQKLIEFADRAMWESIEMVAVWKVSPGKNAGVWNDCRDRRCITIDWLNGIDYRAFKNKPEIKRALIEANEGKGGGGAVYIWRFCREIRQGDVVVANDGLSRVVGIGRIASGYLPPDDRRNPNRTQDGHRHARLVDWRVVDAVDLPSKLFNQPTVHALTGDQCGKIVLAYIEAYPHLKNVINGLFDQSSADRLGPAAEEGQTEEDDIYAPLLGDNREKAWRAIKMRRGREQFRNDLFERYGKRCLVTGCAVEDVLEAAHIDPYRDKGHNHPGNGLVLRADIHTLFDLDLLGVEPETLEIELHPTIAEEYKSFATKKLGCEGSLRPLRDALSRRYKKFKDGARRNA